MVNKTTNKAMANQITRATQATLAVKTASVEMATVKKATATRSTKSLLTNLTIKTAMDRTTNKAAIANRAPTPKVDIEKVNIHQADYD